MLVSKNFDLREFIYPELYYQFGNNSIWFISPCIVNIAQWLRDTTGKRVTINNWHWGGQYKESGLRAFNTATGGLLSLHKFGEAIDPKVEDMTPPEVHQLIKANFTELSKLGLTTLEDVAYTPTWTHIDCRWWNDNLLHIVKP